LLFVSKWNKKTEDGDFANFTVTGIVGTLAAMMLKIEITQKRCSNIRAFHYTSQLMERMIFDENRIVSSSLLFEMTFM
jgi:hypothetical protein